MTQLSLSWDKYKQNICNGLCSLQQNGEFVDMTIAADGHHVKVHQLVMSLVSPYIKELISSAQCPHPVIFLNKVSYPVLCSILEYIYTGEVLVSKDDFLDLVEAAQQLRIRGLADLKIDDDHTTESHDEQNDGTTALANSCMDDAPTPNQDLVLEDDVSFISENEGTDTSMHDDLDQKTRKQQIHTHSTTNKKSIISKSNKAFNTESENNVTLLPSGTQFQYSITNQGSLQLIMNRYLYYLRYTCKRGARQSGQRLWRCVDFIKRSKCTATIATKDDKIVKRYGIHNHPFHDKDILKKVKNNSVFGVLNEAETEAANVKNARIAAKEDTR